MNAELTPLWSRISDLTFELPDVPLPFSRRLARENGWGPAYTRRVLDEYRRFLFLATSAGHPVTPSDAVDEVWHLHLLYTRSYWDDLCRRDTLGRPLHHGPTKGGASEDIRFEDQYARTLASYREWFGREPPADIWPGVADQFAPDKARRRCWVDTARYWVVPQPRLRLPRAWRSVGAAAGCVVIGLLLTGAGGGKGGGTSLGTVLGIAGGILVVAFSVLARSAGSGGDHRRRRGGSGTGGNSGGDGGAFLVSCGSGGTGGGGGDCYGDGGRGDGGGDGGSSGCGSSGCGSSGCGGGGCGS